MKLYEHPECGNSHKVRLLLSFVGLEYESVTVDLLQDAQHQPEYLAVNPRGEVPALSDGGLTLRDSMAILVYLAATYAPTSWYAEAPADVAAISEWLAFAASWVQYGVFTARALVSFGIPANGMPTDFPASLHEARLRGRRSLEILEGHLASRDWLALGRPTIADVANFPCVALAPMGDIPLTPYPAVEAWIARFAALPGYVSMPGLEDPHYRR
ncbi:MAG: glutathione S-transferase family protein [Gammaproteobacteria bacterium]|nr:glutathione S-transferase family protein [Gammaproteobacteria bacterium]